MWEGGGAGKDEKTASIRDSFRGRIEFPKKNINLELALFL